MIYTLKHLLDEWMNEAVIPKMFKDFVEFLETLRGKITGSMWLLFMFFFFLFSVLSSQSLLCLMSSKHDSQIDQISGSLVLLENYANYAIIP